MITLTEHLPQMPICIESTRMQGLFAAYGTKYPFLTFWQQTQNGQAVACLCRFYGNFTLWACDSADFDELREFLQVLAEGEVFCTAKVAQALGFVSGGLCCGLKCNARFAEGLPQMQYALQEVYRLLSFGADGPVQLPDFEDWYPDFSHRLRHGCATFAATPHSVAAAGFVAEQAAVITGVAVDPARRGQGLGAQTVASLCGSLQQQQKQIFVYTTPSVAPFYQKMGFGQVGQYAIINRI